MELPEDHPPIHNGRAEATRFRHRQSHAIRSGLPRQPMWAAALVPILDPLQAHGVAPIVVGNLRSDELLAGVVLPHRVNQQGTHPNRGALPVVDEREVAMKGQGPMGIARGQCHELSSQSVLQQLARARRRSASTDGQDASVGHLPRAGKHGMPPDRVAAAFTCMARLWLIGNHRRVVGVHRLQCIARRCPPPPRRGVRQHRWALAAC